PARPAMSRSAQPLPDHPLPSSVRFPVQPRLVPPVKAARWLHLTLDEFRAALPALRKEGFPAACPVTGHYDLIALQAWQDRRSGLSTSASTEDRVAIMRERISGLG